MMTFCATIFLLNCSTNDTNTDLDYEVQKSVLFSKLEQIQKSNSSENYNRDKTNPNMLVFTEEEKASILQSSIQVLNSKGINNQMIIQEFGSLKNPEIVTTSLAVARIVDATSAGHFLIDMETGYNYSTDTYVDVNSLFSRSDANRNDIMDCALGALGIPAGLIIGAAGGSTSTAALLKAARKLATRTLGWIGAGIAVYDFGSCMDWW